jgi:hypothetical protein
LGCLYCCDTKKKTSHSGRASVTPRCLHHLSLLLLPVQVGLETLCVITCSFMLVSVYKVCVCGGCTGRTLGSVESLLAGQAARHTPDAWHPDITPGTLASLNVCLYSATTFLACLTRKVGKRYVGDEEEAEYMAACREFVRAYR